jgi:uncharacterized protein
MKLENSFEVPASPEAAWDLLLDVPRVVPCMPGAELTETVDETHWKAKINVKLGPISLTFLTDVARDEADEATRTVKLSATGREARGRGQARATVESKLEAAGEGTRVDIATDLSLSGPAAQYGRGLVADVSEQLVGRFADCLRSQLDSSTAEEEGTVATAPAEPPRAKPVGGLRLGLAALWARIKRLFRRR